MYILRYFIMFYICRKVLLTICVNAALVNLIILVNYYTYPDVDSKHVNILRVCRQLCCYRKYIGNFSKLLSLCIGLIYILYRKHYEWNSQCHSVCDHTRTSDQRMCNRCHARICTGHTLKHTHLTTHLSHSCRLMAQSLTPSHQLSQHTVPGLGAHLQ